MKESDNIFKLAFSFLMLNTDQHNKEVENKMGLQDFTKIVWYVVDDGLFSNQ